MSSRVPSRISPPAVIVRTAAGLLSNQKFQLLFSREASRDLFLDPSQVFHFTPITLRDSPGEQATGRDRQKYQKIAGKFDIHRKRVKPVGKRCA